MVMEVTVQLPEDLVSEAQAAGLLTGERLSRLLRAELARQQHIAELRQTIQQLRALEPAITPEEIEAEIQADRDEQSPA